MSERKGDDNLVSELIGKLRGAGEETFNQLAGQLANELIACIPVVEHLEGSYSAVMGLPLRRIFFTLLSILSLFQSRTAYSRCSCGVSFGLPLSVWVIAMKPRTACLR